MRLSSTLKPLAALAAAASMLFAPGAFNASAAPVDQDQQAQQTPTSLAGAQGSRPGVAVGDQAVELPYDAFISGNQIYIPLPSPGSSSFIEKTGTLSLDKDDTLNYDWIPAFKYVMFRTDAAGLTIVNDTDLFPKVFGGPDYTFPQFLADNNITDRNTGGPVSSPGKVCALVQYFNTSKQGFIAQYIPLDQGIILVNETAYVPADLIMQTFGYQFDRWDSAADTAYYKKVTDMAGISGASELPAQLTKPYSPPPLEGVPDSSPPEIPVAAGAASATSLYVTVNGGEVNFPDQGPVILNGRVLVPVRALGEALGAAVDWDPAAKTVSLTKDDKTVKLTIGSARADANGAASTLDAAPVIINGRTMLPARFVAEAFDYLVIWNADYNEVDIFDFATLSAILSYSAGSGN